MANQIVDSNKLVQAKIDNVRTIFNTGHTLKLFSNNVTPAPGHTSISFYTEATFSGYASQSLTSDFAASTNIVDGEYQILSSVHVWSPPGSGSQTIYGWWIDDGSFIKTSFLFDTPVVMSTSNPALAVQIAYQEFAKSIL